MKKTMALLLALLLLLSACTNTGSSAPSVAPPAAESGASSQPGEDNEPAQKIQVPDFTLESSDGSQVSLSDYAGKVVVLNMWASWCPPCKSEMPDFQKLYDEVKDSDEVALLMLNQMDGKRETREKALDYLEKNSFTFPILYDDGTVSYGIFGSQSIPVTVVIDKEGNFYNGIIGMTTYDRVVEMIEGAKDA